MPKYKDLDKMMTDMRKALAEQAAALTGKIGDVIVDNVEQLSRGRIPPPKVISATSEGVVIGYGGKDSKDAINEEINGTRPMANTINSIRADLAGLLRKRGVRGISKS